MHHTTEDELSRIVRDSLPNAPTHTVTFDYLKHTIAVIEQELEKMRTHRDHIPEMRIRGENE